MKDEKKLIDANACPCKDCLSKEDGCYARACPDFATWITSAVDAIEVVRCKDCEHFEEKWSWDNLNTGKVECCGYCYHWDYEQGMSPNQVDGDDFCSYGQRKQNGDM